MQNKTFSESYVRLSKCKYTQSRTNFLILGKKETQTLCSLHRVLYYLSQGPLSTLLEQMLCISSKGEPAYSERHSIFRVYSLATQCPCSARQIHKILTHSDDLVGSLHSSTIQREKNGTTLSEFLENLAYIYTEHELVKVINCKMPKLHAKQHAWMICVVDSKAA